MSTTHEPDSRLTAAAPPPCQAIPSVSRHGWREDVLCASSANSEVSFYGRIVAVCRIHHATYVRWGADAEARAVELWDWRKPSAPGV